MYTLHPFPCTGDIVTTNRQRDLNDRTTPGHHVQDEVTASLNSVTDFALPNISQAQISDTVAVSQCDDLTKRGKVGVYTGFMVI